MESLKAQFKQIFSNLFQFEATTDQFFAIDQLSNFVGEAKAQRVFILKGYAGTGKTTLISNFVNTLHYLKRQTVLMAPTGRAAKVFSSYAKVKAYTIHKRIYRKVKIQDGSIQLALSFNVHKNTIFIVDEASMIGDYTMQKNGNVSERNLLEDLFSFVFSGENNALILVGDEGQLPPIGADFSPALDCKYLAFHFPSLSLTEVALEQVLRQASSSEILINATKIRNCKKNTFPKLSVKKKELFSINGLELQDALESAYNFSGVDETIIISKSNKRANLYNQEIRKRILFMEEEISSGDRIMVVKNNYFWVGESSEAGFIANGELLKIRKILKHEELYGFNFVHAQVELIDYPEHGEFKTILFKEVLNSESASLSREEMRQLFFAVEQDYLDERNKQKRYEKILSNPYFNALQVKFAYAITCHKSQGGQWEQVFLDHGKIDETLTDNSFNRWLYTGFTRAKEKLYLINFDERLF